MLKAIGTDDVINFDYVDRPSNVSILSALKNLFHLNALDANGHLTILGRKMSFLPLEPSLAKVLLASIDLLCSY